MEYEKEERERKKLDNKKATIHSDASCILVHVER